MICIFSGKCLEPAAIEIYFIDLNEIRVLPAFASTCFKDDGSFFFVNFYYSPDHPFTLCNLIDNLAGLSIIQIQMIPAISFGGPDYLFSIIHIKPVSFSIVDK